MTSDVSCELNAALRFFISPHMHGVMPIKKRARNGSNLSQAVLNISVTFCPVTGIFSHSEALRQTIIPTTGLASLSTFWSVSFSRLIFTAVR